ncbi:MAG: hypothetical protein IJV37_01115 [Bacteroidales bacterium]|nr:hypothetical protein [Bacteroidales bacterium]
MTTKAWGILPAMAAALLMVSCTNDKYPTQFEGDGHHIVLNKAPNWNYFDLPAYVGDLSAYPAELQTVINEFFPRRAGIPDAKVIFLSASEMTANSSELAEALDKDAFVIYPGPADASLLGINPVIATLEEASEYTPLFHCHSNYGAGVTYTFWAEPAPKAPEAVASSMSESEWQALVKTNQSLGAESGYVMSDYDNDADFNVNYYQTRIHTFVNWLESSLMEQVMTKASPYEDLKANIENLGQRLTHNFPYSLSKQIDKATGSDPDVLSKSSSLDVEYRIYPCYMQSSNNENAGDYYSVVATVTPHNGSMWGPFVGSHGACRNRVYGFWFNKMNMATSLVNTDGSAIGGLEYFDRPIPENKNTSKDYSSGKSISFSGTVSGGWGGSQAKGVFNAGLSFGATWTSSTNYTLETIDYSLDSSDPSTVKYNYSTNNVKLTDDYDDWNKINNEDFPAPVRTEFSSHTMWTWHIPGSTVKDSDTKKFKLKTKITINYATWYHWRGSAEFDSNKKDYDIELPEFSWELKAPDRTPWGFINLRNASNYEMAHVSYYEAGKEDGEPLWTNSASFGKGDEARVALKEGTYSIRWDLINGDTQEKFGTYIYHNVKVHQGRDKESATITISSVDGQKE